MEMYFTVKLWTEYIIPVIFVLLLILILLLYGFLSSKIWDKKVKILKKYGYQRVIVTLRNAYNKNEEYKWTKNSAIKDLPENKMNKMKIKELKEWLKNNETVKEREDV